MSTHDPKQWRASAIALVGLFLTGCDKATGPALPSVVTHPVSGSLLIDGKPAVRAAVTFHGTTPAADGKVYGPSAHTDDNGGFRLTTIKAYDGAPEGEYRVTVVANWVSKNGQDVETPDLLKGKYSDPAKTPLTVTIREGENELEQFDLDSSS